MNSPLVFNEAVPLLWRELTTPPTMTERELICRANEERLRIMTSMEEFRIEAPGELSTLGQDLQRIEFKINLTLELVAQLVSHQISLPAPTTVQLSPEQLRWQDDRIPAIGAVIQIEIYLQRRYPFPLVCIARVTEVEPLPGGGTIVAALEPMGDVTRDLLEKLIFRYHRRQVARARQQGR